MVINVKKNKGNIAGGNIDQSSNNQSASNDPINENNKHPNKIIIMLIITIIGGLIVAYISYKRGWV